MGQVMRAYDVDLARWVAIKLIHAGTLESLGARGDSRRRLRREAQAVARLNHPNIVQIYHILETDFGDAIVMEYVHGESLVQKLAEGGLDLARCIDLGRQIAEGLAEAHSKGIVHRDLKAANAMVTDEGRIKLLDFGLAKVFKPQLSWDGREDIATAALEMSASGVLGSYDSMSPEQIQGRQVGPASDLFSLGLLLYAMVSGRKPFGNGSAVDTVTQICFEPHPPLRTYVAQAPDSLVRLIDRLLEKQPRDRPASSEEVAGALRSIELELAPELIGEGSGRESASGTLPATALRAILAFELSGRESLWEEHDPRQVGQWVARHDALAEDLEQRYSGLQIEERHGLMLLFEHPIQAIAFAVGYHRGLEELSRQVDAVIEGRVGIHFGEVRVRKVGTSAVDPDVAPFEVEGLAKAVSEGLMALAAPGQILLTRGAFDLARNSSWDEDSEVDNLRWLAHGEYRLGAIPEPVSLFEVSLDGSSPLAGPVREPARQSVRSPRGKTILGWRPAVGQSLPGRHQWTLEEKLGQGGFGEVWKAAHRGSGEVRVFKFCFEVERLRALQREITVFRLLKEELGERPDIARILDWHFSEAPYYIESEYTEGGSLVVWIEAQGGAEAVALEQRLEIVAQVADALAAAHSVGVLHKDVKPGNVLISTTDVGQPKVRLADFGVGTITDQDRLHRAGITVPAWAETVNGYSGGEGTRLYQAPELMEGKIATVQADVYALGVMLYQAVIGDFGRALGPGWERDIDDELLREDIASAVDASPERRLDHVTPLASRLRSLEERRRQRQVDIRAVEDARQVQKELEKARSRRKFWALAFLIMAIFGGTMAYQAQRISKEVERANRSADTASEVSQFLVELFQTSNPWRKFSGQPPTLEGLLELGSQRVRDELEGQPLVQARLMETIGLVLSQLGDFEAGYELLSEALEKRQENQGEDHLDCAETMVTLGELLGLRGDSIAAEEVLRRAVEIQEKHLGPQHPALASSLEVLARSLAAQHRDEEAEALVLRGLATLQGAGDEWSRDRGSLLFSLGNLEERRKDFPNAERRFTEGLEIWSRVFGEESVNLAEPYAELGYLYVLMHRFDEARAHMERSRKLLVREVGQDHPFLAAASIGEGDILRLQGDLEGAEASYLEALRILGGVFEEGHPALLLPHHGLALIYWRKDDLGRAREYFDQMFRCLPPGQPKVGTAGYRRVADYVRFLEETGQDQKAREVLARLGAP